MEVDTDTKTSEQQQVIKEGQATVFTSGKVFYNPVQEFNRDLSIAILSVFAAEFYETKKNLKRDKSNCSQDGESDIINVTINSDTNSDLKSGEKCEDGIVILEALSATGLRSIRYAKEIPGVKQIVANDWSEKAASSIKENVKQNNVDHLVTTSQDDAAMLMYQHRRLNDRFSVVDLDPYGCPSIFLDAAVQCVTDGGLLLVTATDMAVLAGNSPETCYVKYGAVSLKMRSCHEMGLRILLQCIESHANRYGRYIVPLLSLSADFYIRVFVKIFSGPSKCKYTTSKLSMVYYCTGCENFVLQPLGILKPTANPKQVKFGLPTGPVVNSHCEHCDNKHHIGGPIWSAPIHDLDFVSNVLNKASKELGTWKRIQGVLSVVKEEIIDAPLYYTHDRLSSIIRVETPPLMAMRSAILNAGYKVSYSHAHKTSIKTNAPMSLIWDILRDWEAKHPIKRDKLHPDCPGAKILSKPGPPEGTINWEKHPHANPESRKLGYVRFQENPTAYWGPGTRATAMTNSEQKMSKSRKNQGKYSKKREHSNDSLPEQEQKLAKQSNTEVS